MQIDPQTLKKIRRFRSMRRGYGSFLILLVCCVMSLGAEMLVNSRALVVRHNGRFYFPTYTAMKSGQTFGLDYEYETNYRDLKNKFASEHKGDFVILPPVPYNPFENDLEVSPPAAPSVNKKHFLGTDTGGRDVLARIVYGFRIALVFALGLVTCEYLVGVVLGCLMGYVGGKFDLLGQRLIEIWSNIPVLYVVMIVAAVLTPNFWTLILILLAFGWMGKTAYMRSLTYKEKACEYVLAAKAVGMSDTRIMFTQILPNTLAVLVTLLPFSVSSGIVSLSVFDFLGFGLPPPTPSWGELLRQGTQNMRNAPWICASLIVCMAGLLTMITFVGEAVREAFDPKRHTTYE